MSALHLVTMPKWGLSMEEGQVVAWHKAVGEPVAQGEDLIDVETTKITNTVEAPASGVLRRIVAATGVTAACGAPLAIIGSADVAQDAIDLSLAEQGTQAAQAAADGAGKADPVIHIVGGDGDPTRIRYLDVGAGQETIVLIHGFGGDLENWMFNQPTLAQDSRVIAIDLPGHGGTEKRVGDGSAATLAAVVARLLDEVAPGEAHIVSHSFGAMVARALAVTRPERVASFTAIAPADLGMVERAYIDGFLNAKRRSDLNAAIALLFADPALATRDMAEALLRYKRLDGVEHSLRTIDAANFADPGAVGDAASFWRDLGGRGLIIWGAQDAVVPVATASIDFADVVTHILDGAGHMPHLEKAERVNSLIRQHVAAHPSGARLQTP